jgi:hypothetical protein
MYLLLTFFLKLSIALVRERKKNERTERLLKRFFQKKEHRLFHLIYQYKNMTKSENHCVFFCSIAKQNEQIKTNDFIN